MEKEKISHKLKEWFFLNRRLLPWRENPSPYEVWISEVMLQQTQVAVVIPYFQKWMKTFPTIEHLAQAPIERVIKVWEGLGYYSRARNLHAGAQYLVEKHQGELPSTYAELKEVKGLGPYTIGAILSFAFKQKAPAVDGNVLRVLSRYYLIEDEIDKGATRRHIEKLVADLLPDREPWIVMEALIELGALVCQKKARCTLCPLRDSCQAHLNCKADQLPNKRARAETTHLHRHVAIIHTDQEVLLQKGEAGQVMADLWEFPYFDQGTNLGEIFGEPLRLIKKLPEVTHGFTRYKAFLYPHLYHAKRFEANGYEWVPIKEMHHKPFSSGHRKILHVIRTLDLSSN